MMPYPGPASTAWNQKDCEDEGAKAREHADADHAPVLVVDLALEEAEHRALRIG
jgi:hypothetical protein